MILITIMMTMTMITVWIPKEWMMKKGMYMFFYFIQWYFSFSYKQCFIWIPNSFVCNLAHFFFFQFQYNIATFLCFCCIMLQPPLKMLPALAQSIFGCISHHYLWYWLPYLSVFSRSVSTSPHVCFSLLCTLHYVNSRLLVCCTSGTLLHSVWSTHAPMTLH